VEAIRELHPKAYVEVLTPDFGGDEEAIRKVVLARPDVFGHNVETVRRLTPKVRGVQMFLSPFISSSYAKCWEWIRLCCEEACWPFSSLSFLRKFAFNKPNKVLPVPVNLNATQL